MTTGTAGNDLTLLRKSAAQASRLLKALGNADRLMLLCDLAVGERCVSELEARLRIGQPTLSQQLGVLRQEGLVETRRDGKHIRYRLASGAALAVMRVLHDQYCRNGKSRTTR